MLKATKIELSRNTRIKISVSVYGRIEGLKWRNDTKKRLKFTQDGFEETWKKRMEINFKYEFYYMNVRSIGSCVLKKLGYLKGETVIEIAAAQNQVL